MKNKINSLMALAAVLLLWGSCKKDELGRGEELGNVRYNSLVFEKSEMIEGIPYATSTTQGGVEQTHQLDVYTPEGDSEG
ncbi:MAG: hypothetical protein AAF570_18545, partial [Bacteroidota bacterium]